MLLAHLLLAAGLHQALLRPPPDGGHLAASAVAWLWPVQLAGTGATPLRARPDTDRPPRPPTLANAHAAPSAAARAQPSEPARASARGHPPAPAALPGTGQAAASVDSSPDPTLQAISPQPPIDQAVHPAGPDRHPGRAQAPLNLGLPAAADRAASRPPAAWAAQDPRLPQPPSPGHRFAATLGTDTPLRSTALNDGARRWQAGSRCVQTRPARDSQINPFDSRAQRLPQLAEGC